MSGIQKLQRKEMGIRDGAGDTERKWISRQEDRIAMSSKKAITLMFLGLAIMAVPFFIRRQDKKRAENYIEQMGVTEDEESTEIKTGNSKKKASEELPEEVIGIIEVESLDIRYPVFEGAGDAQLNNGIGHLTETAGLCETGNCVLAGHNGSRRGTFFTNLSHIEIGATVVVTNKEKVTHTYVVVETGIAEPYDASVCEEREEECLTLFTCTNHGTQRLVCRCRATDDSQNHIHSAEKYCATVH